MLGSLKKIFYKLLPNTWLLYSGPKKDKSIYLTFDDGPHGDFTLELLKILRKYDVKASFFVTGDHAKKDLKVLEAIDTEGHDIYNHAYTHWGFDSLSTIEQIQDINKLDEFLSVLKQNVGIRAFRPPRGNISFSLLLRLIISKRQVIYWSFDSKDYLQLGTNHIIERFKIKTVKAGDIILFHDDNSFTIEAVSDLIQIWKKSGLAIKPISHLVNSR